MRRTPAIALAAAALALVLLAPSPALGANLPPAGTDVFVVEGDVSVTSVLGSETIPVQGSATVVRQAPHMEGPVEVVDMEVTALSLKGASQVGSITIVQRPTPDSTGELRALNPPPNSFPASSFFDVYADITVPASPGGTLVLHNNAALRLTPPGNLNAWPPYGVIYSADPNPCLPLLPDDPYGACIESMSVTLSGAVGGLSELPETDADQAPATVEGEVARPALVALAVAMLFAATVWFARRRLSP